MRIWALLGARAGDNNQVIALAEALGLPFEKKQLDYNGLRRLGPRLLGTTFASLSKESRASIIGDEPPDLTISAGHRSVPVVRKLRRLSVGGTRSIHIGFPRISPAHFDLVIATPQYPIPDHPNLLRVPIALTPAAAGEAVADQEQLSALPHPRRLLIVGGPNIYWQLDRERLRKTLASMIEEARSGGGSVLVTTSPRTPEDVEREIKGAIASAAAPTVFARPGEAPSYASLLAAAESICVTDDSVAMVSDAIWSGKPVARVPVMTTALGRVAITIFDKLRPAQPLYPQDLRRFWQAVASMGVNEQLATPSISAGEVRAAILDRARSIIGGQN